MQNRRHQLISRKNNQILFQVKGTGWFWLLYRWACKPDQLERQLFHQSVYTNVHLRLCCYHYFCNKCLQTQSEFPRQSLQLSDSLFPSAWTDFCHWPGKDLYRMTLEPAVDYACHRRREMSGGYMLQSQPRTKPRRASAACGPGSSYLHSGRISGNRITSRMEGESVNSMTRRSMPMPSPAVGGMPYSRART